MIEIDTNNNIKMNSPLWDLDVVDQQPSNHARAYNHYKLLIKSTQNYCKKKMGNLKFQWNKKKKGYLKFQWNIKKNTIVY